MKVEPPKTANSKPGISTAAATATATGNQRYFCSALVADALKVMGVVPSSLNPGYFWPGSFSSGSLLDEVVHENGYRFSKCSVE
jgi:hypothetical protein